MLSRTILTLSFVALATPFVLASSTAEQARAARMRFEVMDRNRLVINRRQFVVAGTTAAAALVTSSSTLSAGEPVEVRVFTTYTWLPIIGEKISILQTTISGKATMRIEQKPVNSAAGAGGTPATC